MKNNKVLIIIGIILINVLVAYTVVQGFTGKPGEFDVAIKQARALVKKDLYSRALEQYDIALASEEGMDTRIEKIDAMRKGLEFGEFSNVNDMITETELLVEKYPKEIAAYEKACSVYMEYGKYEECTEMINRFKSTKLVSKKMDKILKDIRYIYDLSYTTYTNVSQLYDGAFVATLENGEFAYLNSEGQDAFEESFIGASSFSQGYAYLKKLDKEGKPIGIVINKSGQRQAYLSEIDSSSGIGHAFDKDGNLKLLLSGKTGEKYKYYTIEGKEAFGEYVFAGRFRNDVAAVQEKAGEWKLINGQGKEITKTVFEDVALNEFDECAAKGVFFAKKDGKYRLYGSDGKQIGKFECDEAKPFVDSLAPFKKDEMWGYVDMNGKVVIEPKYKEAQAFSCGIAAVKNGKYWNYINADNEVVIEGNFEEAGFLSTSGLVFVKVDGRYSCLEMYYKES